MKQKIKLTRYELMEILGVKNEGLKTIEKNNKLQERLQDKGYEFVEKIKEGRSNYYIVKQCKPITYIPIGYENIDNFKVDYNKRNNTGVYIIIDEDKNCYIGSTIRGFRHRFRRHWNGHSEYMRYTYNLLHDNNGNFYILEDMTGKSEHEIRKREDELIREYEENPEYNVINRLCGVAGFNGERIDKLKKIKIKESNYFDAIRILNENGIEVIL